jgi:hypothetical protein
VDRASVALTLTRRLSHQRSGAAAWPPFKGQWKRPAAGASSAQTRCATSCHKPTTRGADSEWSVIGRRRLGDRLVAMGGSMISNATFKPLVFNCVALLYFVLPR